MKLQEMVVSKIGHSIFALEKVCTHSVRYTSVVGGDLGRMTVYVPKEALNGSVPKVLRVSIETVERT